METPNKTFSDVVALFKSWIPWRSEPAHVSRDFWMPDQSCRVCYECDCQFTIFNRRHHCRLCGRVFCGQCTANSVPASSFQSPTDCDDWEKIRVCNYCFKQWQMGRSAHHNGNKAPNSNPSTSPSASSLASYKSGVTSSASSFAFAYTTGAYQRTHRGSGVSPREMPETETSSDMMRTDILSKRNNDLDASIDTPSLNQFSFLTNRSDDDEDEYGVYRSDSDSRQFCQVNEFFGPVELDDISNDDISHKMRLNKENNGPKSLSSSPPLDGFDSHGMEEISQLEKKDELDIGDDCEGLSSTYDTENVSAGPVDFENDGLLWLPPEPEDEEDERETGFSDDDDDGINDPTGEWGYLRTSSFGSGEFRNKEKSGEENKKVMKNVVDGHFRALVAQLLQVENLPLGDENDEESWLEIITSLSWEAATLLKPDMSKGGGMDPGGYVKVKCLATGRRCDSMVVKGVVCKKNVAHRRMTSKLDKPRLLILGGALEYQRVSNLLSSFDTLLQQEMDHLKMAVAKIDAHQPDILLVEKSVSRFAQEYLLEKDISLVLNIKRPLLERIARCTGAQIVPSIDHLASPKLGYCEKFHVDRFLEDLGTAGQGGKKLMKTLMYFEGCPKPLGFTILLRGANGDELKKVKHVVQYGLFAAYHLALETSFLADEGASLPELPMNSPISVALPDKSSTIERSISTVPGFTVPSNEVSEGPQPSAPGPHRWNSVPISNLLSASDGTSVSGMELNPLSVLPNGSNLRSGNDVNSSTVPKMFSISPNTFSADFRPYASFKEKIGMDSKENMVTKMYAAINDQVATINGFGHSESSELGVVANSSENDHGLEVANQPAVLEVPYLQQNSNTRPEEPEAVKEEFPPSPSDHQSILVSLSSRCVWKGTVCERSHLFRIKYYGNFDKPLGRFLRDHLFDQNYRCRSCEMPSEAHVHCYTHRQGTLTISVKKLPELLLPGEKEGKIWMWHRCLQCPRVNGFPPATRRVVMSDAAWGLSFGKFLELSFSNHAAASRVASCGHSLHRDCLRFYGFGKMVACFRYASIDVHTVFLPPNKLEFNYNRQEWIQKEVNQVIGQAELLFSDVLNALSLMADKRYGEGSLHSGLETKCQLKELEEMLQREKVEFEESLQKVLDKEVKKGQPVNDILEIYRLRRQLLFQSYMWDHRLIYAASLMNNSPSNSRNGISDEAEKLSTNYEKMAEKLDLSSLKSDSVVDLKIDRSADQEEKIDSCTNSPDRYPASDPAKDQTSHAMSMSFYEPSGVGNTGGSVRRTLSEGQVSIANLSDTLEAAWTGENIPAVGKLVDNNAALPDSTVTDSSTVPGVTEAQDVKDHEDGQNEAKVVQNLAPALSSKGSENMEDSVSWLGMPFLNFYRSLNKNFLVSAQKLDTVGEYTPKYISSFRESEQEDGAKLFLPVGVNDTVIPVFDDEPTSIISYALVSPEYHLSLLGEDSEKSRESGEHMASLSDSVHVQSFQSLDESNSDLFRSLGSTDESFLSSRSSLIMDPVLHTKALHPKISFKDDGPVAKVRYSVTCYYAKRFEALRRICCPSELDYVRSLSRCKKWGAQGGKSNVFFAKTLDDRFIIKQVTKTELESFIKFAPEYFKYLSESIITGSPTCLAKILGIYQVTTKHVKGGRETKIDVLVMENLLFSRSVTRLYDLKGSSRSRYNPDSSGSNKVLLDQNLIEAMPTSPIFVGNKAKRLLERAVWNDTAFLASVDVMDYSLLVGVDEEKHELVVGIIDFMRQYTWDKHLETWVKASGILGGPKNASPTVISPKQYKKRFRKAMTTYFLMVPDQWSPATIIPSKSQSDFAEENT